MNNAYSTAGKLGVAWNDFVPTPTQSPDELFEQEFEETFEDGISWRMPDRGDVVQGFIGTEHRDIADLSSGRELTTILYGERGERLTFGEVVALAGDHFETYEEMRDMALTPAGRAKIAWARWYALDLKKQKVPEPMADKNFVMERYYLLASRNVSHFSAGGTAFRTYTALHGKAIASALQAGEQASEQVWRIALTREAFALHFLTDMFSAGHVRIPRIAIRAWYQQNMAGDHLLRYMAKFLYDKLGQRNQLPMLAQIFSGTAKDKIKNGIVRLGGAAVRTISVGDIVSLALHDLDNRGLRVISEVNADGKKIPGGFRWTAVGDAHLHKSVAGATTSKMATAAVITSLRDLERVRGVGRKFAGSRLSAAQRADAVKKALGSPIFAAAGFVPKEDRTAGANVSLPSASGGKSPLEWRWGQLGDSTYKVVDETVKNSVANDLHKRLDSVKDQNIRSALASFVEHLRSEGVRALVKAVAKNAR